MYTSVEVYLKLLFMAYGYVDFLKRIRDGVSARVAASNELSL